ncbi:hypothetical protein BDR26DRAFT_930330 [Obelidium mucronatum]|nr:hypothetical protein BDR26DRAFT_930330 [Obelidium mucronatum]
MVLATFAVVLDMVIGLRNVGWRDEQLLFSELLSSRKSSLALRPQYGLALPAATALPPTTQVQSLVNSKAEVKGARNINSNLRLHEVVRFYDAGSKMKLIVFLEPIHDTTFVISVSPDGRKLLYNITIQHSESSFYVDPRDKGAQLASTQAMFLEMILELKSLSTK